MKHITHPAFAFVSAALAACCLLAGRARTAAVRIARAARPAHSAAQSSALLDNAGRALDALRRRMRQAARRALTASLLLLAAPGTALLACREPEVWTDIALLPAGAGVAGGRTIRLPRPVRTEHPRATPPPGTAAPSSNRDGPASGAAAVSLLLWPAAVSPHLRI